MAEEENKNLKDELDDMLDSAKDGAKKLANEADKISQEVKEKSKETFENAKEFASDIAGDAKEVLSNGKNIAIIAHLTIIGWIIAIIMNSNNKTELGSFYIRQMLGILLIGFVLSFIPIVNFIAWIFCITLWIVSIIGAFGESKKPIFLLGEQFQDWFKGL